MQNKLSNINLNGVKSDVLASNLKPINSTVLPSLDTSNDSKEIKVIKSVDVLLCYYIKQKRAEKHYLFISSV